MQLNMSATSFQTLPANDNVVRTGPMGDCVSVIVLYNLVGTVYRNVRGRHGFGGVENVDFAGILAGVPNAATSQVIVIPGSNQRGAVSLENIRTAIGNAITRATLGAVTTRVVSGMSDANVDRQARVTPA
jgi:hypothetical protein